MRRGCVHPLRAAALGEGDSAKDGQLSDIRVGRHGVLREMADMVKPRAKVVGVGLSFCPSIDTHQGNHLSPSLFFQGQTREGLL